MQISSATPAPAADTIELRRGDDTPVPVPGREMTAAERLISRYRNDFFAIPGVVSITWSPTKTDFVQLNYRTEADRQIGNLFLEDTVNGVRLLGKLSDWTGGSPAPDPSLWKHQAAIAAVNALPGVWNSITWSMGWEQNGVAQFHAINQATVDRLDPLVRDRIEGPTRADGSIKYYDVEWRAGVPA